MRLSERGGFSSCASCFSMPVWRRSPPAGVGTVAASLADRAVSLIAFYGQPVSLSIPLDFRVAAAALLLSLATALVIGLLSTWQIVRRPAAGGLVDGRSESGGRRPTQRAAGGGPGCALDGPADRRITAGADARPAPARGPRLRSAGSCRPASVPGDGAPVARCRRCLLRAGDPRGLGARLEWKVRLLPT